MGPEADLPDGSGAYGRHGGGGHRMEMGGARTGHEPAGLHPAPPGSAAALLGAGVVLGLLGDTLLRAGGPPALNVALWIASVAVAVLVLYRRAASALDGGRVAWLAVGVLFAAGLAWRDAPPLKLLALGSATLAFALAA